MRHGTTTCSSHAATYRSAASTTMVSISTTSLRTETTAAAQEGLTPASLAKRTTGFCLQHLDKHGRPTNTLSERRLPRRCGALQENVVHRATEAGDQIYEEWLLARIPVRRISPPAVL